jgi:hypothetical protein
MSAFLGKIHYWLFDKIKLHETLIDNIIEAAKSKGFNPETLLNQSYSKYGYPVTGALEDEIEHTNIHGWLQERIISAESRLAYIVTELLNSNVVSKEEIADVFYHNGLNKMKEIAINEGSPEDFFNLIFDYMLEGMPCDHVSEVIESDETKIKWQTTMDLHKAHWDKSSGDVNNFYYFRDSWIKGFLSASNAGYKYSRTDDGMNIIEK